MVYKMGQVAEKALSISINRFVECKDSSKDVQELSEILVSTTAEVEEKAFSLIVKYQPVASDLRIINSYMKVAYDFERFGDTPMTFLIWENISLTRRCVTSGFMSTLAKWLKKFSKWSELALTRLKNSMLNVQRFW